MEAYQWGAVIILAILVGLFAISFYKANTLKPKGEKGQTSGQGEEN